MSFLPILHGEFRAVTDPELRFSPSGKAFANLRIAANSRRKNDAGEWVDDKSVFLKVVCFGRVAENVAESITRGALIFVSGRLYGDEYETKDGEKRTQMTVMADAIGPSVTFKPARILEPEQRQQGGQQQGAPADDPWASGGQPAAAGSDEPPF